jgi:uncharacterized OB-fold protein
MSGIFDRIRSGAGKAALEADKLRRIASVQSTIKSLKEEINQAFYHAGYVAFDLHRAGRVTQPELQEACKRIAALQAQIAAREREIDAIRSETYVEPARGPQYGHLCPNGHGELPPGTQFCPACGAQAIDVPPPAMGTSCLSCGAALVPEARFCPKCGASVPEPSPPSLAERQPYIPEESPPAPPPPGASVSCPACGTVLAPEACFCPECGAAVPEPPPPPATAQQPQALEESSPVPSSPALAPICPKCGASLVPEAVFCPDCGHRLTESTDTASELGTPQESAPSVIPEPSAADTDQAAGEWKL